MDLDLQDVEALIGRKELTILQLTMRVELLEQEVRRLSGYDNEQESGSDGASE